MSNQGADLTQTFDWIFFAIVLLPTAAVIWDWLRNREGSTRR